jgi:iron complex transport system permease protein
MTTARDRRGRLLLLLAFALLAAMVIVSLLIGARTVAPAVVIDALLRPDMSLADHSVILTQRVPRTVIGVMAGAALALAGTLMQGLTRNPLADPGLLGVNAGASPLHPASSGSPFSAPRPRRSSSRSSARVAPTARIRRSSPSPAPP